MCRLFALVLLAACDTHGSRQTGGPQVDFTIGGIAFHLSDGVAVIPSGGGIAFYLSDQPNACLALQFVPVGPRPRSCSTSPRPPTERRRPRWSQRPRRNRARPPAACRAPPAGSRTRASRPPTERCRGPRNADGSYALTSIDVGFAGTTDRLITAGLTLRACKP